MPQSGLLVDVDRGRLVQVVLNLLTNASKFTPVEGHVRVSAAAEGNDAVLHVTDEGTGIDPVLLPEIFELFVQSSRTLERSEGGLGLVTGYGHDSDRRRGVAAGFDAFFTKPLSFEELMSEIGARE